VSGHRIGTAEVESALVQHPACAESAVVGVPHEVKGQTIYAFCILKSHYKESEELVVQLKQEVRKHIGFILSILVIFNLL
jgi:acetyl-CoA synthetase